MNFFGFTIKKNFNSKVMQKAGNAIIKVTMKKTAIAITNKAKELCPKRYGYLAASINYQGKGYRHDPPDDKANYATRDDEPSNRANFIYGFPVINRPSEYRVVNIGTDLVYAPAVEFGSRAHPIPVKNKKALSDMTKFYGKIVNNPGHAPHPFMRPALDWSYDNFSGIIRFKKNLTFTTDGVQGLEGEEGYGEVEE